MQTEPLNDEMLKRAKTCAQALCVLDEKASLYDADKMILHIAMACFVADKAMYARNLVNWLTEQGYTNHKGEQFVAAHSSKPGSIYSYNHDLYGRIVHLLPLDGTYGLQETVSRAFVDESGNYSYE